MATTVFLVRWHGGWHEVSDATGLINFGRQEAMLSLGAQQSLEEVERLSSAELSSTFAKNREQLSVEHRPDGPAEYPYLAYIPSSQITADDFNGNPTLFPVLSLTVTEDVDGELHVMPALGDIIVGVEDLQEQIRIAPEPPPKEFLRGEWRRPGIPPG